MAVIGCALARQLPAQVLFHTGTKERKHYISQTALAEKLGADVCNALPGLHTFAGCDTTSSFSGKGKRAAFALVNAGKRHAMQQLGQSFSLTKELVST